MTDVTIPADVAKRIAHDYRALIRDREERGMVVAQRREWADLLDPEPPTLRELVSATVDRECDGEWFPAKVADAVLAVVGDAPIEQLIALVGPRFADWLAAQPAYTSTISDGAALMRAHDVRLLRGES